MLKPELLKSFNAASLLLLENVPTARLHVAIVPFFPPPPYKIDKYVNSYRSTTNLLNKQFNLKKHKMFVVVLSMPTARKGGERINSNYKSKASYI
ncbi:hypothetical protein AB0758_45330 [Tolypothrix bouteillei VB521301_2]|uniref:hypothetical protein n=1 Tax=Tolypothrix bouteillei TaxID=1246981 RepID=UPI0038B4E623